MSSSKSIDKEFIHDLAELLSKTDLTEIEVEISGSRVRVARQISVQNIVHSAPAGMNPANYAPSHGVAPVVAAPVEAKPETHNAMTSPMVGTVYLAPNPDSAPFIKVGDSVKEGQTILIVEAMKVMNNIPAPQSGIVKQILVSDKTPVEYGQPLVVIE